MKVFSSHQSFEQTDGLSQKMALRFSNFYVSTTFSFRILYQFTKGHFFYFQLHFLTVHAGANYYIRPFGNSILTKNELSFCKIFQTIY